MAVFLAALDARLEKEKADESKKSKQWQNYKWRQVVRQMHCELKFTWRKTQSRREERHIALKLLADQIADIACV
jgi:hypothetical protein